MMRKWLFLGLTLVLVAVLVSLIVQGHRLEKEKANQPVEIIQESTPTATRVLAPNDIQFLQSGMKLEEKADNSSEFSIARHEVEFRNSGTVSYEKIQLSFNYMDRDGKVLANKTYSVAETIRPQSTLKLLDIAIDDVPKPTADFRAAVIFADIATAPASEKAGVKEQTDQEAEEVP